MERNIFKMKIFIFLFFCITLETACSSSSNLTSSVAEESAKKEDFLLVQNGKISFLEFPVTQDYLEAELWCMGKKWPWLYQAKLKRGISFLAVDYFASRLMGDDRCIIKSPKSNQEIVVKRVVFASFPYLEETLAVATRKIYPGPKDRIRIQHEQEMMRKVYEYSHKDFYFSVPFSIPLASVLTSIYGNRRVFNKSKKSQHLGNDFRAAPGTPVPVSNRGRVVHVGNLFYSGNQIVVDHGGEIFSIYAHLSEARVKIGDMVERGDIIGLSGRTGRVSGPHLHWGIKVGSHLVDGLSLVEASRQALPDVVSSVKQIELQ